MATRKKAVSKPGVKKAPWNRFIRKQPKTGSSGIVPSESAKAMARRYAQDEWGGTHHYVVEAVATEGIAEVDRVVLLRRYGQAWEEVAMALVDYCKDQLSQWRKS